MVNGWQMDTWPRLTGGTRRVCGGKMKAKKVSFRDAAHEQAIRLAMTRTESGDDILNGAILAIDPRDDKGLALSSTLMAGDKNMSMTEAREYLIETVDAARKAGGCAAVCHWTDPAPFLVFLTLINHATDSVKRWIDAPIDNGFVRLAMFTHGRFSYEILPLLPMAEA